MIESERWQRTPDRGLLVFREGGEPVLVFAWTGVPPTGVLGFGLGRGVSVPLTYRFRMVQVDAPWPTPDPASQ